MLPTKLMVEEKKKRKNFNTSVKDRRYIRGRFQGRETVRCDEFIRCSGLRVILKSSNKFLLTEMF